MATFELIDMAELHRMVGFLEVEKGIPHVKKYTLIGIFRVMQREAKKAARPHDSDSGELANSLHYTISGDMGTLYSTLPDAHVAAAEYGRDAGSTAPPLDEIREWADRHGLDNPFAIARAIGEEGTDGLYFFETAYDIGSQHAEVEYSNWSTNLEQRWTSLG